MWNMKFYDHPRPDKTLHCKLTTILLTENFLNEWLVVSFKRLRVTSTQPRASSAAAGAPPGSCSSSCAPPAPAWSPWGGDSIVI